LTIINDYDILSLIMITSNVDIKNKQVTISITQRGQVTLPVEVMEILGVKPRGKVEFHINNGEIKLAPAELTLDAVFGSVQPKNKPEDFEEIARQAKEEKAEKTIEELKKK